MSLHGVSLVTGNNELSKGVFLTVSQDSSLGEKNARVAGFFFPSAQHQLRPSTSDDLHAMFLGSTVQPMEPTSVRATFEAQSACARITLDIRSSSPNVTLPVLLSCSHAVVVVRQWSELAEFSQEVESSLGGKIEFLPPLTGVIVSAGSPSQSKKVTNHSSPRRNDHLVFGERIVECRLEELSNWKAKILDQVKAKRLEPRNGPLSVMQWLKYLAFLLENGKKISSAFETHRFLERELAAAERECVELHQRGLMNAISPCLSSSPHLQPHIISSFSLGDTNAEHLEKACRIFRRRCEALGCDGAVGVILSAIDKMEHTRESQLVALHAFCTKLMLHYVKPFDQELLEGKINYESLKDWQEAITLALQSFQSNGPRDKSLRDSVMLDILLKWVLPNSCVVHNLIVERKQLIQRQQETAIRRMQKKISELTESQEEAVKKAQRTAQLDNEIRRATLEKIEADVQQYFSNIQEKMSTVAADGEHVHRTVIRVRENLEVNQIMKDFLASNKSNNPDKNGGGAESDSPSQLHILRDFFDTLEAFLLLVRRECHFKTQIHIDFDGKRPQVQLLHGGARKKEIEARTKTVNSTHHTQQEQQRHFGSQLNPDTQSYGTTELDVSRIANDIRQSRLNASGQELGSQFQQGVSDRETTMNKGYRKGPPASTEHSLREEEFRSAANEIKKVAASIRTCPLGHVNCMEHNSFSKSMDSSVGVGTTDTFHNLSATAAPGQTMSTFRNSGNVLNNSTGARAADFSFGEDQISTPQHRSATLDPMMHTGNEGLVEERNIRGPLGYQPLPGSPYNSPFKGSTQLEGEGGGSFATVQPPQLSPRGAAPFTTTSLAEDEVCEMLRSEIKSSELQRKKLENEKEQLEVKLQTLEDLLDTSRLNLEEAKKEKSTLRKSEDMLKEEVSRLERDVADLQDISVAHKELIQTLEETNMRTMELEGSLERTKNDLVSAQNALELTRATLNENVTALRNCQQKNEEQAETISAHTHRITKLERENSEKYAENGDLRSQLNALNSENNSHRLVIESLSVEKKFMESSIGQLTEELSDTERALHEERHARKEMGENYERKMSELLLHTDNMAHEHELTLNSLIKTHEEQLAQAEQRADECTRKMTVFQQKAEESEQGAARAESEFRKAHSTINLLQQEVALCKDSMQDLEGTVAQKNISIKNLEDELSVTQSKASEFERQVHKQQIMIDRTEEENNNLKHSVEMLTQELRSVEELHNGLQEQIRRNEKNLTHYKNLVERPVGSPSPHHVPIVSLYSSPAGLKSGTAPQRMSYTTSPGSTHSPRKIQDDIEEKTQQQGRSLRQSTGLPSSLLPPTAAATGATTTPQRNVRPSSLGGNVDSPPRHLHTPETFTSSLPAKTAGATGHVSPPTFKEMRENRSPPITLPTPQEDRFTRSPAGGVRRLPRPISPYEFSLDSLVSDLRSRSRVQSTHRQQSAPVAGGMSTSLREERHNTTFSGTISEIIGASSSTA